MKPDEPPAPEPPVLDLSAHGGSLEAAAAAGRAIIAGKLDEYRRPVNAAGEPIGPRRERRTGDV